MCACAYGGGQDPLAVRAYFHSNRASCGTLESNRLQSPEAPAVYDDIMSLTLRALSVCGRETGRGGKSVPESA